MQCFTASMYFRNIFICSRVVSINKIFLHLALHCCTLLKALFLSLRARESGVQIPFVLSILCFTRKWDWKQRFYRWQCFLSGSLSDLYFSYSISNLFTETRGIITIPSLAPFNIPVSTPVPDNQRSAEERLTDSQVTSRSMGDTDGLLSLQQGTSLPEHCLEAITEFSPDWSYPEVSPTVNICQDWR